MATTHTLEFELKLNSLVRKIGIFELEGQNYKEMLSSMQTGDFTFKGTLNDFKIEGDLDVLVLIYCRGISKDLTLSISVDGKKISEKPMTFTFDNKFRGILRFPTQNLIAYENE